jgi:hypothetical protein
MNLLLSDSPTEWAARQGFARLWLRADTLDAPGQD